MDKLKADFLLTDIGELATVNGPLPRRGRDLGDFEIVRNAAVASCQGKIIAVGPEKAVLPQIALAKDAVQVSAKGMAVVPGFVDSHTHVVFGGSRADEFALRLSGVSYEEITARGGGINSTVTPTRQSSEADLLEIGWKRLDSMLLNGATTAETKSGYALDTPGELKTLRVIKKLAETHPMTVIPTFLGAHLVPREYKGRPDDYVELILREMLPAVASEKLAVYNDVFCENCAFDVSQTERVLAAGQKLGLKAKVHVDEMNSIGGVPMAVRLGAVSVDHLVMLTPADLKLLAKSSTVATMMPGTSLFLNINFAPAKELVAENALVALATDFNPGSAMCENMQIALALACIKMGITPAQALAAATIGGAQAVERADSVGSIEPGKFADLLVLDTPTYIDLCYHWGVNHVSTVIKQGKIVVENRQLKY